MEALPEPEQRALVRAIVRREMGVMATSALVVASLGVERPVAMSEMPLSNNVVTNCYNSASVIRSYLPALVFVGLGTILGLVFAVLNSFVGPRGPVRQSRASTRTSAASPPRSRRTSASGSAST